MEYFNRIFFNLLYLFFNGILIKFHKFWGFTTEDKVHSLMQILMFCGNYNIIKSENIELCICSCTWTHNIMVHNFFNHYLSYIRSDFENLITKSQVINQDLILVSSVSNAGSLTNYTFQICYFPFIFTYAKYRMFSVCVVPYIERVVDSATRDPQLLETGL